MPSWYNDTSPSSLVGWLQNSTDYPELGGADSSVIGGVNAYPIGSIRQLNLDNITLTKSTHRLNHLDVTLPLIC